MRPSVSILCHAIENNAFGRAWLLSELLRDDFAVEIVAAARPGAEIWQPARESCSVPVRRWDPGPYPRFVHGLRRRARALVQGDVIYAVKPRLGSFGLGLAARAATGKPLLLDIDDYDPAFSSLARDLLSAPAALLSMQAPLHTRLLARRIREADAISVSNGFLHARYGGTWIPHARDAQALAPALDEAARAASAPRTVMFLGTPRRHKGLTLLLSAFRRVRAPARLRIVGGTLDRALVRALRTAPDSRIAIEPPVPLAALAGVLASADVVVIPQDASLASQGQLPAKLLDAMAMGKAIVSTAVGDIPHWLAEGAGVVVAPGDAPALAAALDALLTNPARMAELGARARARFLAYGAYSVVRPRLVSFVQAGLARDPSLAPASARPIWEPVAAGAAGAS